MVYLRDVAYVHDGASFQTNIARRDGQRGVLQVDSEERQGLDARRRGPGARRAAQDRRHAAARTANDPG